MNNNKDYHGGYGLEVTNKRGKSSLEFCAVMNTRIVVIYGATWCTFQTKLGKEKKNSPKKISYAPKN